MENRREQYGIRAACITVTNRERFLGQLRGIMRDHTSTIICFNADSMAGIRHADTAMAHALRSFRHGSPIAKTLEMEALLYAAGTRQCAGAAAFGIHSGENRAYICCCPPHPGIWDALATFVRFSDDPWDVLDPPRVQTLKNLFLITDVELSASGGPDQLQDLVIERVALLDAYK